MKRRLSRSFISISAAICSGSQTGFQSLEERKVTGRRGEEVGGGGMLRGGQGDAYYQFRQIDTRWHKGYCCSILLIIHLLPHLEM